MKIAHWFTDRPIFATVISVLFVLLGLLSLQRLPISEYPEVVPPTIVVRAAYPGAAPETIASTVAGPLEQQMTGLPGLLYQTSQSSGDGVMALTMTFQIGTDMQEALVEAQNRLDRALPRLPEEVRRLGVTAQKASGDFLMVVHLVSPDGSKDMLTLANYARLHVKDELARVGGAGDVVVYGAGEYSMRVWLDPDRLNARGLTAGDVANAIRSQNVQVAAGSLGQQPDGQAASSQYAMTVQGRLETPEEFSRIVVSRGTGGQLVRLADVARVELGGSTYAMRSLLNNQPAAACVVLLKPGSNALETSNAVRATMERIKGQFPQGISYDIVYDTSLFVRASISAVIHTLLEAIVLVVIVVVLFLQTWRASVIPLLAVPVSLVGTFAVMQALGFSINALSLFGLVLAIGIVVDDAIVVVENVERNLAKGLSPREAVRVAMDEVSGPIIATALVLAAVFIPTAFIPGLTGQFYQQFALTIAISTVISAINSLTLSPALAALILKPHAPGHRAGGALLGWFFAGFNRAFAWASGSYAGLVARTLRFSVLALVLYALALVGTAAGFQFIPKGFIPEQDKGYLISFAQLPDGASLDRTEAVLRRMNDIALQKHGDVIQGAVTFPGLSLAGFSAAPNSGVTFYRLKPFAERAGKSAKTIAGQLSQEFGAIPEALALAIPPPPIIGLGTTGGYPVYIEDRGGIGLAALNQAAQGSLHAMLGSGIINPWASFSFARMDVPRVHLDIDREKAESLGVGIDAVHQAVQGVFGQIYVNDFNRDGRTWQVNLQADAQHRLRPDDLLAVQVRGRDGALVPLASLARIVETAGPDRVTQYNTYPAIDLTIAGFPGVPSSMVKDVIEQTLAKTLPPGVHWEYTNTAYLEQIAGNAAAWIFPICVLLVILVLAAFYESWALPLAIVLIVPMCIFSALIGVYVAGTDNNIMTQIGFIVLVGLACKNAILIVEFAKEAEVLHGKSPWDAALEACRLRLRPILMTSIAFIAGTFPLVIATGAGAELRHTTGVAVFAGMIGVTLFGLFLTPVFYVVIRKLTGGKLHGPHRD